MINSHISYASEHLKGNKLNSDPAKENYDSSSYRMLHAPTAMQTLDTNTDITKPAGSLLANNQDHTNTNVSLGQQSASLLPPSFQNTTTQSSSYMPSYHPINSYTTSSSSAKLSYASPIYATNNAYYSNYQALQYHDQNSSCSTFTTSSAKFNLENQPHLDYGMPVSPSASMPYLFSHIDSHTNPSDNHDIHHQLLQHQTIQELSSLTNLNANKPQQQQQHHQLALYQNHQSLNSSKQEILPKETYQPQSRASSDTSSSSSSTSSLSSSSSINDVIHANPNDNSLQAEESVSEQSNGLNQSSKPPVIYAWMKKVHMNNGSEWENCCDFRFNQIKTYVENSLRAHRGV